MSLPHFTPHPIQRAHSIQLPPLSDLLNRDIHHRSSPFSTSHSMSPSSSSSFSAPSSAHPPSFSPHHSLPQVPQVTHHEQQQQPQLQQPQQQRTPIKSPPKLVRAATTSSTERKSYAFISHSPATFPSHEPSIDNAQLARRKRRRTSPNELNILQREFESGHTPNKARRQEIASRVNMTEKAVQIWFQNKRQALRKAQMNDHSIHQTTTITLPEVVSPSITNTPIKYNAGDADTSTGSVGAAARESFSTSPMSAASSTYSSSAELTFANIKDSSKKITDDSLRSSPPHAPAPTLARASSSYSHTTLPKPVTWTMGKLEPVTPVRQPSQQLSNNNNSAASTSQFNHPSLPVPTTSTSTTTQAPPPSFAAAPHPTPLPTPGLLSFKVSKQDPYSMESKRTTTQLPTPSSSSVKPLPIKQLLAFDSKKPHSIMSLTSLDSPVMEKKKRAALEDITNNPNQFQQDTKKKNTPKASGRENECVENLLSLRSANWK